MNKIKEALFYTSLSEKRMMVKDVIRSRIKRTVDLDGLDNELISDDLLTENFDLMFKKKIVVCCADDSGRQVDNYIQKLNGADIYAFCEKYADHWKRINKKETFLGKPVISLLECEKLSKTEDIIVILATNDKKKREYIDTIKNEYRDICPIVTWIGFLSAIFYNIEDERFDQKFRNDFKWDNIIKAESGMWNYYLKCVKIMMKDEIIMVYAPSKTGTTSIYKSLLDRGIDNAHIHLLSGYNKKSLGYVEKVDDYFSYWKETIPYKKSIKVITLVRDPVARSISHAFEMIEYDHIKRTDHCKSIMEDTYKRMKDDIAVGEGWMFEWFKVELGQIFGIDIFEHEFNREKGYMFIEKGNIKVLVMTLEKMNSNVDVIGEFCGIPDFRLKRANGGQDKLYKYLYSSTLKELAVPDEVLEFYYGDNDSMKFFYEDKEIEKFRKKWSKR